MAKLVIGIDTGGTFTDCVYRAGGKLEVLKLRSTPEDPGRAILEAITTIASQTGADQLEIRHGTTVATNALLERKGARVAFVTTAGFEDTLAIGRQARPDLYDWNTHRPEPLALPDLCFGVRERIGPDGAVVCALDKKSLEDLARKIKASRRRVNRGLAAVLIRKFRTRAHRRGRAAIAAPAHVAFTPGAARVPRIRARRHSYSERISRAAHVQLHRVARAQPHPP